MSDDLRDLLRSLKSHKVDFVVVGSHVLAAYARPRYTEDLDLWIRRSEENALNLAASLREFGFSITDEQALRLAKGRNMIRLGAPPNRVDILNFLGAVGAELEFDVVRSRAASGELFGEEVHWLSREDFIASKRAAGRKKDLRDLEELEESS